MKVCRPDFYKDFQCIGSGCSDTCCALWEIEVDESSAERYEQESGPLAADLKKYLVRKEDENYFRLTEDKRCPFLNEQNLCRMILTMGEEYICDICREHPRFYHWFGSYTEVGLGLCCEEAGRFLFSAREPLGFELLSDDGFDGEEIDEDEDYWVEALLDARRRVTAMLQNRSLGIKERYRRLLEFAEQAQPYLDEEDADGFEAFLTGWTAGVEAAAAEDGDLLLEGDVVSGLTDMLDFYEKLESLDHKWPDRMRLLKQTLPELLKMQPGYMNALAGLGREYDYENLLVYFVFRYFMEAVFDGNLLSPIRFACASLRMILLLDLEHWTRTGRMTLKDRINIAKWYSKEIEYCPDNMELLTDKLEEDTLWL